jgi:hypothetical protein
MSQFITSAGKQVTVSGYSSIKLVPGNEAQEYIKKLLPILNELDGENVYLLDDRSSGTSEEIFIEVEAQIERTGSIEDTELNRIVSELYSQGHTIRIWEARIGYEDYKKAIECKSLKELDALLVSQYPGGYFARVSANKQRNSDSGAVAPPPVR